MSYLSNGKKKKHRYTGLIGTLLFHGILGVLFLILGLSAPDQLPRQKGVIVDLGKVQSGKGVASSPTTTTPSSSQKQKQSSAKEEVMTQDHQEAPALPKKEEEQTPETEKKETTEQQTPTEKETKEETSQEETTKEQPEKEKKPEVNEKALYKGSNDDAGEGDKTGDKDQGSPEGEKNGASDGKQQGSGKPGIGYSLQGRSMVNTPAIQDKSQATGKVVVDIRVDKNGNVTKADYSLKGSTTNNAHLIKLAKKAARQTKFNADANAPEKQFGTITFNFKLR